MTRRDELLTLADAEEEAAWRLYKIAKGAPMMHCAHDAAVVCANRAASLRELAEQKQK